MWWLVPVGAAVALMVLWLSLRTLSRKRLIDDLPTSKTTGMFIGLVELAGTDESERPLRSHLAEVPCVWFSWEVEEHWQRLVTETTRDAQGRTQTRTRTESGWSAVAGGMDPQQTLAPGGFHREPLAVHLAD